MKKFNFIVLLVILSIYGKALADECDETETSEIEECDETEYSSYIDCVRRRTKRHAGCSQSCDSCNCNSCTTGQCNSHCNVCCGNFEQPCETKYCCYKTCHSQCSNQGCRDSCRRTCSDRITNGNQYHTKEIITHTGTAAHAPNITTIINLHNRINNTNIIDVPINLKTDNINNITINTSDLMNGTGYSGAQRCCQLVSPRQCTPTSTYPFMRCYHLRKRTCGNICRANIMHAQPHQVCDQRETGPPDCHNQVIYIPQPQPRCAYRSQWPYVSCNIPTANCEGCYEHYVTDGEQPSHCPHACYSDGYGVGPYMSGYRPNYGPSYPPMQHYPGYDYAPPSGVGAGYGGSLQPLPYSSIGNDPSAYEHAFVVQRNAEEGPDLSKIFPNPTQNDDYDAQTLPITNSITQQQPSTLVDPTLVKIETVNATDVLMTIKEMNDEGSSVDEDDVTVSPTNVPSLPMDPNMFSGDGAIRHGRDDKKVKDADILSVMMADEEAKNDPTTATTTKKDRKSKKIESPSKLSADAS